MFKTFQEVAVYIHRFHNLDLFQQGWYQIKVSMRWEDGGYSSLGVPARVVQYEGSDDIHGVWRIDDKDNTFSTQPFRIKYARQDVHLSVLISFGLYPLKHEIPPTSAVILKFELMYAPTTVTVSELPAALNSDPAAVHEFRIPPKALLGVHSYCPVHFDMLHSVLIDVSIHISLLATELQTPEVKVSSYSANREGFTREIIGGSNKVLNKVASLDMNSRMPVKTLLDSRNTLCGNLEELSGAVGQAIEVTEHSFGKSGIELLSSILNLSIVDDDVSGQDKPQICIRKVNASLDSQLDAFLNTLSLGDLLRIFNVLGHQVLYLWGRFLSFHRANSRKILNYLHDQWAKDRRAEWSIWTVYSKVEMPHHYLNSGINENSNGPHKRVSSLWKLNDDPVQAAVMRGELHRRSIAQMKINSRSLQDMHIFGDPSRIPIVFVERVMNAPRRTFSDNSYLINLDVIDMLGSRQGSSSCALKDLRGPSRPQRSRDLKIVVFVHGFQGHHLDLRLVRNQWLLIDPKIEFLMSEANEDKTTGDIREMGHRLAKEVVAFIKKKMDKFSRYGPIRDVKLSFVGHSIGNVILRTAIADGAMEPYLKYLHTYMSVSGPHLGYLYSSNSLFNSGLWILKKLKNTQCIHQLTLTDDPDLEKTFFYKLCKQKTLEYFRHIILLSSPQDGYVPYHSARIEICPAASFDYSRRGKVFLEMLNSCLDQIRAPSLHQGRVFMRCDVHFDPSAYGKNFNSIIGRAAHIDFLESDTFARFIMWSFSELFM